MNKFKFLKISKTKKIRYLTNKFDKNSLSVSEMLVSEEEIDNLVKKN